MSCVRGACLSRCARFAFVLLAAVGPVHVVAAAQSQRPLRVAVNGFPASFWRRKTPNTAPYAPDVRERITNRGSLPKASTPAEFEAFVRAEVAKVSKVIRDGNIRIE